MDLGTYSCHWLNLKLSVSQSFYLSYLWMHSAFFHSKLISLYTFLFHYLLQLSHYLANFQNSLDAPYPYSHDKRLSLTMNRHYFHTSNFLSLNTISKFQETEPGKTQDCKSGKTFLWVFFFFFQNFIRFSFF